jgi:hypothetical protein
MITSILLALFGLWLIVMGWQLLVMGLFGLINRKKNKKST